MIDNVFMMEALLHFTGFLAGINSPHVYMSADEQEIIRRYSKGVKYAVEIGCYEGYTSRLLSENTDGQVYTIDPFIRGRLGICYSEMIARIHNRKMKNLHFIKGYSYEVATKFNPGIDFILFDAEFGYDEIRRDLETWVPKVIRGGHVAIHCGAHRKHHFADLPIMQSLTEAAAVESLFVFKVQK